MGMIVLLVKNPLATTVNAYRLSGLVAATWCRDRRALTGERIAPFGVTHPEGVRAFMLYGIGRGHG